MSGATYTNTLQFVISDLAKLLEEYQKANVGSLLYATKEDDETVGSQSTYDKDSVVRDQSQDCEKSKSDQDDEETKSSQLSTYESSDSYKSTVADLPPNAMERRNTIPQPAAADNLLWLLKSAFYNNDLKSAKVSIIGELLHAMDAQTHIEQSFTKLPIPRQCSDEQRKLRENEVQGLLNTLETLKKYVEKASNDMMSKRRDVPPKEADALLNVVSGMLDWMKEEDNLKLLYIALGYDGSNKNNQDSDLLGQVEKLEISYVTDLFKWLFTIKQDELVSKHCGRPKLIPNLTSEKLTLAFKQHMRSIYRGSYQNKDESERISTLTMSIYALQHLCSKLSIKPGILPATIASTVWSETFLQRLPRQMAEYETRIDAKTIELTQKIDQEQIKEIQRRRVGVSLTN